MYDGTTYRNHAKNLCVFIAFAHSNPIPLLSCKLHALLSAAHILFAYLLELYCDVELVSKLHLNLNLLKTATLVLSV